MILCRAQIDVEGKLKIRDADNIEQLTVIVCGLGGKRLLYEGLVRE